MYILMLSDTMVGQTDAAFATIGQARAAVRLAKWIQQGAPAGVAYAILREDVPGAVRTMVEHGTI